MSNYFVSYNQADEAWAAWLGARIEALNHRVVLRAWDFHAGDNFVAGMQRALQECDKMVMVLSRQSRRRLHA